MPDQFAADAGQHIDPQGHVTYDFQGHVHAQGLDIDAGINATLPNDRRVRWLRTSDGSVVANIIGYETTTPAGSDHLGLQAGPDINGYTAQLALDTFTGSSFVAAQAYPGPSRRITDHNGKSDYALQRGPGLLTIGGAYQIDSGTLAAYGSAGDFSTVDLTHNLGQTAYALGGLEDVAFSIDINWSVTPLSVNSTRFNFRNHNPTNTARAILRAFLITLT